MYLSTYIHVYVHIHMCVYGVSPYSLYAICLNKEDKRQAVWFGSLKSRRWKTRKSVQEVRLFVVDFCPGLCSFSCGLCCGGRHLKLLPLLRIQIISAKPAGRSSIIYKCVQRVHLEKVWGWSHSTGAHIGRIPCPRKMPHIGPGTRQGRANENPTKRWRATPSTQEPFALEQTLVTLTLDTPNLPITEKLVTHHPHSL